MLAGVGMGTRPLPTCCESPHPSRHGPRHLPGMAPATAKAGNPKAPRARERLEQRVQGHGQALRKDSPLRWHPSMLRKASVAVQQGSRLWLLASPVGLVACPENTGIKRCWRFARRCLA